MQTVARFTW